MQIKILRWKSSKRYIDDPSFIGCVDLEIPKTLKLLGLKVFRANHTACGLSIKPPYLDKSPCYSLEGTLYIEVLNAIKEDLS